MPTNGPPTRPHSVYNLKYSSSLHEIDYCLESLGVCIVFLSLIGNRV